MSTIIILLIVVLALLWILGPTVLWKSIQHIRRTIREEVSQQIGHQDPDSPQGPREPSEKQRAITQWLAGPMETEYIKVDGHWWRIVKDIKGKPTAVKVEAPSDRQ